MVDPIMASKAKSAEAEKRRKAELELKIRKRVALEEKAHRIVERLLDNPIDPEFLVDCAKFITPEQYQDVTEERGVSQLCGYPICQKYIKDVPKQKYHISTQTNTVYDITERKNFCSNRCFKASNHYKKQIPASPVWARELEPIPHVTLLDDKTNKGSMGQIVFNSPSKEIRQELEELDEVDKLSSTQKAGKSNAESSADVAVLDDLTETFKNKMNELQETEVSAKEVTTEKELSERLAEVYILDEGENEKDSKEDEKNESLESDTTKNATCYKSSGNTAPGGGTEKHDEASTKQTTERQSKVQDNLESKTEKLMQLLDKREALQEQLKRERDKNTSVKQTRNVETERESGRNPDVAGDKSRKVSSGSVLKNIKRYEEQDKLEIDSDDEISEQTQNTGSDVPMVMPSCVKEIKETSVTQNIAPVSYNVMPPIQPRQSLPTAKPLDLIRHILMEWKTDATVEYLRNNQKKNTDSSLEEKYESPGKEIDRCQIDENLDDSDDGVERPVSKVPDYTQLETETFKFDMKVKEYFKGKLTRPSEVDVKVNEALGIQEKQNEPSRDVVLPLVDSYSQVALRRRIVLDKLNRVLPDLLGPMSLVLQDVASDLRQLVYTFNLSSTNITMKPAEWTLIAFFLLKILSVKIKLLREAMKEKVAASFFHILTSGVGIADKDVQSITTLIIS